MMFESLAKEELKHQALLENVFICRPIMLGLPDGI